MLTNVFIITCLHIAVYEFKIKNCILIFINKIKFIKQISLTKNTKYKLIHFIFLQMQITIIIICMVKLT